MTDNQRNTIRDFLFEMRQMRSAEAFGLHAMLYHEEDRDDVVRMVQLGGLPHIIVADQHEDELLAPILDRIAQGRGIGVELTHAIPPKMMSVYSELYQSGKVHVQLAGESESRIINPTPPGAFIILMMTPAMYSGLHATYLIQAVCNVARETVRAA